MKTIKRMLVTCLAYLISTLFAFSSPPPVDIHLYLDVDGDTYWGKRNSAPFGSEKYNNLIAKGYVPFPNQSADFFLTKDCDDSNENIYRTVKLWIDKDGDKRVVGYEFKCIGIDIPDGYASTEEVLAYKDCDDNDPHRWREVPLYSDPDGDGFTGPDKVILCIGDIIPHGYVIDFIAIDPHPNEPDEYEDWYFDQDQDGYHAYIKSFPKGKKVLGPSYKRTTKGLDCDDTKSSVYRWVLLYVDNDEDGYPVSGSIKNECIGFNIPLHKIEADKVKGPDDCDDTKKNLWEMKTVYSDLDGDFHIPAGQSTVLKCSGVNPPEGYIFPEQRQGSDDCSPGDGTKWRNVCVSGFPGPNHTECVGAVNPKPCGGGGAEVGSSIEYTIYPNPVADRLNITPTASWNDKVQIKLLDQYGRVLRSTQAPNVLKGQTFTFNTADLKPGIYRITIQCGEAIVSKTIAVKL